MAVVDEYKIGNTKVIIHDDSYKDKNQEDIDRILDNISKIAVNSIRKKQSREEMEGM